VGGWASEGGEGFGGLIESLRPEFRIILVVVVRIR
jgi:hypothetical protein